MPSSLSFDDLVLGRYQYWRVGLNHDQRYLGRSYVWLNRDGKVDLLDLTVDEHMELFSEILPALRGAYERLFHLDLKIDLINYAWLCNLVSHGHHGHMHVIPRFRDPREFGGMIFTDDNWGKNYAPYVPRELPDAMLCRIRDRLRAVIR